MSIDNIKVTVYCAAYNHEKYIRDTLQGFVRQETSFEFEVLVHDDASTDGTATIIREYELKYPNIIRPIYQKENIYSKGINRTYTYMLPRTRGEYIAICEGDDYWINPHKLQKQYEYMELHPECSLVAHKTICEYMEGGYREAFTTHDFSKPENCELEVEDIINNHTLFHTSSLFFRRDFYDNNKSFLLNNKSFDYVIKILLATEGSVHVIPEVMSVYRRGTENSWTIKMRKSNNYIEHYEYSIEVLNGIDIYRNHQYSQIIQKNILKRKFDLYVEKREFKKLKEKPFKTVYKNLSFQKKLILCIKQHSPLLANYILSGPIYWKLKKFKSRKEK